MLENAEFAATHLATKTWGRGVDEQGQPNPPPTGRKSTKIVQENLQFNTKEITEEELVDYLKTRKRRKAPGPDEIPIEYFLEMQEGGLYELRWILNRWWRQEHIPEDQLRARVILLHKKGPTSNIDNYRPISLLNTITKIFAGILKFRH